MQRTDERQEANANAEEKEIVITFDTALPDEFYMFVMPKVRSGEVWQVSMICSPTDWDTPHVYPKKRKKRKKGFDREITRVKNSEPFYRRFDTVHKQFSHTLHSTGRKNRR